jgi:hypothetical protein
LVVSGKRAGKRAGKPSLQCHLFLISLRTKPKALLQQVETSGALKAGTGSKEPNSMKMATAIAAHVQRCWSRCAL